MKWVSLRFIWWRLLLSHNSFFFGGFLLCFITPLLWLLMITYNLSSSHFLWSLAQMNWNLGRKKLSHNAFDTFFIFLLRSNRLIDLAEKKLITFFHTRTCRFNNTLSFSSCRFLIVFELCIWCNCVNNALFTFHARFSLIFSFFLSKVYKFLLFI